jgi:hypothetical protein
MRPAQENFDMSAISSIGSDPQALLAQRLQSLRVNQDSADHAAQREAEFESALKAAGADPAKLPDLEKQIQDAVQSAQQSASGSTDSRTAVRDAINNVLKQNGIDPAKFEAQMKAQHTGGHRHHPHRGVAPTGGAASTTPQEQLRQMQLVATAPASSSTDATKLNVVA